MPRKEKKSKWGAVLVFFIAFIMISSIAGFLYSGETDQFRYNDVKFIRTQSGWSAVINSNRIIFDYFPSEVEGIEVSQDILNLLSNKAEIDTTSIVNDTFLEEIALAQYNMNQALASSNIYLRGGFTTNSTFNAPIITCEDATQSVPIIFFKRSNQTQVKLENNCIIAEARNSYDILRIKD